MAKAKSSGGPCGPAGVVEAVRSGDTGALVPWADSFRERGDEGAGLAVDGLRALLQWWLMLEEEGRPGGRVAARLALLAPDGGPAGYEMWGVDLAAGAWCPVNAGPAPALGDFLARWDDLHLFAECAARALDPEHDFFSVIEVAPAGPVRHAAGLLLPGQARRRFSLRRGPRPGPIGGPAAGCVIRWPR